MTTNIDGSKPDIQVRNLAQLFGGEDGTYRIPDYQREYSWSDDEIRDLFTDLIEFQDELALGGNTHYLLGQSIFSLNSTDPSSYKLSIVDGQQRMTSLYLFAIALHRWVTYFADHKDSDVLAGLRQVLYYRNLKTGFESPRLSVAYGGDDYIGMLLEGHDLPIVTTNNTQKNIKENFALLMDYIQNQFGDNKGGLISFVDSFLHKIWLVQVTLATDSLALSIFEKLNHRGLPLNGAQLLKVLVFKRALANQFDEITSRWNDAANIMFKVKPPRASSMQFLLKSVLGQRLGSGVSNNKIADAWDAELKRTNEDMVQFALSIKDDAQHLSRLGTNSTTKFNQDFHTAKYFSTVQHLPVALAAKSLSASENYGVFSQYLDARLLLSLISLERPQEFERQIWPWAKNLSQLNSESSEEEILAAGAGTLKDIDLLMVNAKSRLESLDYTSPRDLKMIRFVLAVCNKLAERAADENAIDFDIENFIVKTHYDLDHVYPKSLVHGADFNAENGTDWVHKIGNLTLLHSGDNKRAGAANAGEKSIDYSSARLILTKSLAKTPDLRENDRVSAVITDLRGLGFQQVSASWGYDQVMAQTEAYWNLISRYIRDGLQLDR
jgi:hypothetical protein